MLPVSEAFRELMESNVRPKCEPVITIKDALGTGRDLIWQAKDISKMTFKRGIDPIGRTLPFMELRWTEVYQGKLNENLYPQIYENVAVLLPVELKFKQSLGFYNTWENVFKSGVSWKELFDKKNTWKQVKSETLEEEFVFPMMFLSGKPVLKDNIIEWVAYDLMRYLDSIQSIYFNGNSHVEKCVSYVLMNCCSQYLNQKPIIDSIKKTVSRINNDSTYPNGTPIVFDGSSNSFLKDFWAIHSYYWDFCEDYMKYGHIFDFQTTPFSFPLRLQYKKPTITKNDEVSVYQYKRYYPQEKQDGKYEKEWDSYEIFLSRNNPSNDFYIFKYIFNEHGRALESDSFAITSDSKTAYSFIELTHGTVPTKDQFKISVIPIEINSLDEAIVNQASGEVFIEDNKLSHYVSTDSEPIVRNECLKRYFNKKCDSIEIDCAPNVAIETGDIIEIEINLEDGFGNNKIKKAVVVELEFEYSGQLRQKIKAHEVIQ